MLLIVEKGIRGGICHVIRRYVAANNKYLKNYDKSIEYHIWMGNVSKITCKWL